MQLVRGEIRIDDAWLIISALYEFVETYREKGIKMYGGVLIQEGDNWYFPDGLVDNIDSTDGWRRLDLSNL